MAGIRRKARVIALQTLYEIEYVNHEPREILTRLVKEKALAEAAASFAQELVSGVLQNRQKLDDVIRRFAPSFSVEQMAAIDKSILRIAIFEVLFDNKVPIKVAINEAVELAKAFGSDNSPKFVNGVLGSVVGAVPASEKERSNERKE